MFIVIVVNLFPFILCNNTCYISNIRPKELMPLDRAGFFSFITYSWVTRYMKLSYKQGLKAEDIPLCSTADSCDHSAQRF